MNKMARYIDELQIEAASEAAEKAKLQEELALLRCKLKEKSEIIVAKNERIEELS